MGTLSRSQLVVYGAVAAALLLLGARWIRADDTPSEPGGGVSYASGTERPSSGDSFAVDRGGEDVVVHVAGAVASPGVYRLPAGSRVTDAVARAGGGTGRALLDSINLAAVLVDGQQIIIPAGAESAGGAGVGSAAAGTAVAPDGGPISLGSATLEQLDTIEGIGPITAQKIIEFRDEHGGISSIDQLDEVDGIGPATLEALRERLQP